MRYFTMITYVCIFNFDKLTYFHMFPYNSPRPNMGEGTNFRIVFYMTFPNNTSINRQMTPNRTMSYICLWPDYVVSTDRCFPRNSCSGINNCILPDRHIRTYICMFGINNCDAIIHMLF